MCPLFVYILIANQLLVGHKVICTTVSLDIYVEDIIL